MPPLPQRHQVAPNVTPSQTQLPSGGLTQTETDSPAQQPTAVLRLRGGHNPTGRSVQWREDVIDNEGLGRKKSKVCCIYHRPKGVDESSDESSSDSSSSSDSESDRDGPSTSASRKQSAGRSDDGKKNLKKHSHNCHDHDHDHNHGPQRERRPGQEDGGRRRHPSPNAYEKMPKYKPKDQPDGDGAGASQPGPEPAR